VAPRWVRGRFLTWAASDCSTRHFWYLVLKFQVHSVIRRIAPLLLLAVSALGAGGAQAAIFRIQDSSWNYNPADSNESGAQFQTGAISGDFHINTDYKDANGNTVSVSPNTITAWNIRFAGQAGAFTFADGGSQTAVYDDGSKTVTFNNGDAGASKILIITFGGTILDKLGDTIDPDGISGTGVNLRYQSITSATYNASSLGSVAGAGAQADFVPYAPFAFAFFPSAALALRLKKRLRLIA